MRLLVSVDLGLQENADVQRARPFAYEAGAAVSQRF